MPRATRTQDEVRADALHQLAILGGQLNTEEDIVFEGNRFVIPITCRGLEDAIAFLTQRMRDEEQQYQINKQFLYRPWDGARATANAIRKAFGFTVGRSIESMFGSSPPQFIDIPIGVGRTEQVPWGAMAIPGLRGVTLYMGDSHHPELGRCFQLSAEGARKYRHHIDGLFKLIEAELQTNSIYKGQAIDGAENPNFFDTSGVEWDSVVYTEDVQAQLEANVWSPIRHAKVLQELGQPGKRSVLFEGPYGTGKSLAAYLTAQVAVQHGWTFLICRPGRDNLYSVLQTARMYQPSVVFFEDLDVITEAGTGETVSQILDMFDGITVKDLKMLIVLTTNHVEQIHKGMIRPGRLDAVISIKGMDRPGVERLTKLVLRDKLDPDVDWDRLYQAVYDYVPAFVKESFDRALRYSVARNDGVVGLIDTDDLIYAANQLRDQKALMDGASDVAPVPSLDKVMNTAIKEAIHGSHMHRPVDEGEAIDEGQHIGTLAANNGS